MTAVPTYFRSDGFVKSSLGPAVPGSQVFVLTQPANVPTGLTAAVPTPTPLATIYSDPNGLVPIQQPILTDGFGHYDFYILPGTYTVAIYLNATLQKFYLDQSIGLASGVPGRVAAIPYTIDGGGSTPGVGSKGQMSIPFACTITGWVITADQSGSCVVDVLKSSYAGFPSTVSIAGSDKPTLTSAQNNEDLSLNGWGNNAINAGDIVQFFVDSATTVQRINITLNITIP